MGAALIKVCMNFSWLHLNSTAKYHNKTVKTRFTPRSSKFPEKFTPWIIKNKESKIIIRQKVTCQKF